MWYVMQIYTGTEEKTLCQCRRLIEPEILERCFLPYYQQKKKYEGQWHVEEKILFPGYLFLVTSHIDLLIDQLRKVNGLTRIVKTGDEIVPLSEKDVCFLLRMGKEEQLVELSTGIIENDKVKVFKGPLMGMEGCIKKIDRHKRIAWLSLKMFGRDMDVQVGLEILAKTGEQ